MSSAHIIGTAYQEYSKIADNRDRRAVLKKRLDDYLPKVERQLLTGAAIEDDTHAFFQFLVAAANAEGFVEHQVRVGDAVATRSLENFAQFTTDFQEYLNALGEEQAVYRQTLLRTMIAALNTARDAKKVPVWGGLFKVPADLAKRPATHVFIVLGLLAGFTFAGLYIFGLFSPAIGWPLWVPILIAAGTGIASLYLECWVVGEAVGVYGTRAWDALLTKLKIKKPGHVDIAKGVPSDDEHWASTRAELREIAENALAKGKEKAAWTAKEAAKSAARMAWNLIVGLAMVVNASGFAICAYFKMAEFVTFVSGVTALGPIAIPLIALSMTLWLGSACFNYLLLKGFFIKIDGRPDEGQKANIDKSEIIAGQVISQFPVETPQSERETLSLIETIASKMGKDNHRAIKELKKGLKDPARRARIMRLIDKHYQSAPVENQRDQEFTALRDIFAQYNQRDALREYINQQSIKTLWKLAKKATLDKDSSMRLALEFALHDDHTESRYAIVRGFKALTDKYCPTLQRFVKLVGLRINHVTAGAAVLGVSAGITASIFILTGMSFPVAAPVMLGIIVSMAAPIAICQMLVAFKAYQSWMRSRGYASSIYHAKETGVRKFLLCYGLLSLKGLSTGLVTGFTIGVMLNPVFGVAMGAIVAALMIMLDTGNTVSQNCEVLLDPDNDVANPVYATVPPDAPAAKRNFFGDAARLMFSSIEKPPKDESELDARIVKNIGLKPSG